MEYKEHPHLFRRLLRNNIFRLSVLYSILFLIAAIAMLGVAYVTIAKNIESSIDREVNAEITRFIGTYQSRQLGIKNEPYAFFIEREGQRVAGNITEIPEEEKVQNKSLGLIQLDANEVVANANIEQKGAILGKTITLPDQTKLFIGKNSYGATERREDILDALSTALLALLSVGVTGGLIISFQSIKRIDRISRISQSIIGGKLDLRIPETKHQDDIEDLGQNLNKMLDRIDILMQGMREVTNDIAHDLRTPLTRLRANIETISHQADGELQIQAEKALEETDNLLNTFSSLLRISHVESGTNKLHKEILDYSQTIHDVIDFYAILAEEKQQKVSLSLEKGITIHADKTLLSQAIVNLFTNAVKYTPEKGHIRLSLSAKNKVAELVIHDSGQGVPEEDLDKITQRFYRLEKHRNTENGNGLGLAMVKAIIEAHQGQLSFENDIGLKAIIQLPLTKKKLALGRRETVEQTIE